MTTFEPGARLVFTHGLRSRPRSAAFFASRPAAIITDGFDVFVQLVIAAITTDPWFSSRLFPSSWTLVPDAEVAAGVDALALGSDSVGGRAPGAADLGGSLAGKLAASSWSCAL